MRDEGWAWFYSGMREPSNIYIFTLLPSSLYGLTMRLMLSNTGLDLYCILVLGFSRSTSIAGRSAGSLIPSLIWDLEIDIGATILLTDQIFVSSGKVSNLKCYQTVIPSYPSSLWIPFGEISYCKGLGFWASPTLVQKVWIAPTKEMWLCGIRQKGKIERRWNPIAFCHVALNVDPHAWDGRCCVKWNYHVARRVLLSCKISQSPG